MRPSSPILRILPAVLLLSVPGCGWLNDYQAKMQVEQSRMERFDEENKLLGEAIDMPAKKEGTKDADAAEVFFRPPRGISTTPDKTPLDGFLYRYPRTTNTSPFSEVYVGVVVARKDFLTRVTELLPGSGDASELSYRRDPLKFEGKSYKDSGAQSTYYIYTTQKGNTQVAVVFRVDGTRQNNQWSRMRDLALESLVIGGDAWKMKKDFAARKSRSVVPR